MTLGRVKANDVVHCDVRGQRFWALAAEDGQSGAITIKPLNGRPIPAHVVKARQVVGHWRRRAGSVC